MYDNFFLFESMEKMLDWTKHLHRWRINVWATEQGISLGKLLNIALAFDMFPYPDEHLNQNLTLSQM